jgi:hypothetical protein
MKQNNENIGKRGKFKFMKFRRKNRKETAKSRSHEESRKPKGMALLRDDVDQDIMGDDFIFRSESETGLNRECDPSWQAVDYGSGEKGLQINFSASPVQTTDIANDSFVESSPVSVNNDGFFTDAALDFQSAFDRSTKFSPMKSNVNFDSFEAADDWDLSRGSFDSCKGGKRENVQNNKLLQYLNGDLSPSNQFSPSFLDPNESANEDSEYIGPIDSDTLEKWEVGDDSAKALHHVPTVKRDSSQLWSLHTPDRNVHNQEKSTSKENIEMSTDSDQINYPIDVDTLEPWAPMQHAKSITTEPVFGDDSSVTDDHSRHQNENHIQNGFHSSLNAQAVTKPLTLGMLAQISGLVDYDTNDNDQYGRVVTDNDDTLDDEDAAAEIANAAKRTIEEHEKAGPNISASDFHSPSKVARKSLDMSPMSSRMEKEYGYEIDNISSFSSFQSNSPFKTNLSGIHNQSTHHIQNEATDDLTPPRNLADGLENGYNDKDLVEAEEEMTQILSQFHLEESNSIKPEQKKEINENNVSNVRNFWKLKDKETPLKHKESPTKDFHVLQSVEWPSPAADSRIGEAFKDDFFSRNKTTKPLDVPNTVTAKPSTEMSFATELSSLCEQSFDLTDDGFQVPKREAAKDVYRATKVSSSSHSSKGFFWRSHPDGPSGASKNEEKSIKRHIDPRTDEPENKPTAVDLYLKRIKSKRNDTLLETTKALKRGATSPILEKSSGKVRHSSIQNVHSPTTPTDQPTNVVRPSNKYPIKTPHHDPNHQSQIKHVIKKDMIDKNNEQQNDSKSSPSIEWKKAIEAKIKSTSERIKAARHQANSPPLDAGTHTKTIQPIPKRAPSPFQANKNSFLNKWQAQATGTTTATTTPSSSSSHVHQHQNDDSKTWNGIPILIEKKAVDDDAISGCSSSIADRIKHFESKSQSNKPDITGRSTPLNSIALSKLRTMTNSVGGLWS